MHSVLGDTLTKIKEKIKDKSTVWFRGENKDYKETAGQPHIFRNRCENVRSDESELITCFIHRHSELNPKDDKLSWLSIARHSGLPTRMLDWSSNLLVALYFSIRNVDEKSGVEESGMLYIYDPYQEIPAINSSGQPTAANQYIHKYIDLATELAFCHDTIATERLLKEYYKDKALVEITSPQTIDSSTSHKGGIIHTQNCKKPGNIAVMSLNNEKIKIPAFVPCYPPWNHPRITRQQGMFTIDLRKPLFSSDNIIDVDFIEPEYDKIEIKFEDKAKLRDELKLCGVMESNLFPEPQYTAEYLSKHK